MNLMKALTLIAAICAVPAGPHAQTAPTGQPGKPIPSNNDTRPPTHTTQAQAPEAKPRPGGEKGATTCLSGYIVGIFPARNGWDDWSIWVSPTGPSWSYGDSKEYKFYSHATTDYNSGRIIYSTALQAMALGQKVSVLDWSGNCGNNWAESIQAWYP